jgi:fatty-acyl-CoA synthase
VLFAEVHVVGPDGSRLPSGEIGEIIARAPPGTTAYFQDPQRSAEAFRGGWFHTGDLGRFDTDGYLYVCGRVKDMIISGGQNIFSAEVESTLLQIPSIRECAVIGLPDDRWGERVVAVVVLVDSTTMDLVEVQQFCRRHIAGFKIPRALFVREIPLPRTATGKVQKFRLIEEYRTKQSSP